MRRAPSITWCPSAASLRAAAAPIPLLAPVIATVLVIFVIVVSLGRLCSGAALSRASASLWESEGGSQDGPCLGAPHPGTAWRRTLG
ncbi:hypothetical protein GCM10020229_71370 [Kitasatospora albolonga]